MSKEPFLNSASEGSRLRISSSMSSLTKKICYKDNEGVKNVGFQIKQIEVEMKFECMQDEFGGAEVDTEGANNHVEEVERET